MSVDETSRGSSGPPAEPAGSDQTPDPEMFPARFKPRPRSRFEDLLGVGPVPEDRVPVRHHLGPRVLSARAHPNEDQDQDGPHLRHVGSGLGSDSEVRTLLSPFSLRFGSLKAQTGVHVLFRKLKKTSDRFCRTNSGPRTGPPDGTWWDQNPQRPASKHK